MEMVNANCNGCNHVKVCKYREEFLKAQEAMESTSISIGIPHGSKPITAIECIEPIKLRCKFREHEGNIRNKIRSIGDTDFEEDMSNGNDGLEHA